ncbi:MAG: putative adenylyltransferase/sulfurtransferase MoeZ [Chloroflexi bacterium]|nr:putative adenylyltransferase/sulfurtransferase MoeZ [Chloroflexota bacterium]
MIRDRLREQLKTLAELEGDIEVIALKEIKSLSSEFDLPCKEVELAALDGCVLPRRYLRSLGTVGWDGQARLLRSTVAVVGLGGLGGYVVEALARMGVGVLILIEGDAFVDHNLNRQMLATEDNLGASKVEAARARVARINSAVRVVSHAIEATPENLSRLLETSDVVVDALDRLPTRIMLQEAAQKRGIPLVHGAIGGMMGQVMTIFPEDEGLYALYGRGEVPERGIEVEQGCPTATPMMVAAWQAQEVMKILVGIGEPLRHRLLLMDAESGTADLIRLGA